MGFATWMENYCKYNYDSDLRLTQERLGMRRKGRLHRCATLDERSDVRFHDIQGNTYREICHTFANFNVSLYGR